MDKKGIFLYLIKTALILLIITFLIFYFLSGNNSSKAGTSTKAMIETLAETAHDFAKSSQNISNKSSTLNVTNSSKAPGIVITEEKAGKSP